MDSQLSPSLGLFLFVISSVHCVENSQRICIVRNSIFSVTGYIQRRKTGKSVRLMVTWTERELDKRLDSITSAVYESQLISMKMYQRNIQPAESVPHFFIEEEKSERQTQLIMQREVTP